MPAAQLHGQLEEVLDGVFFVTGSMGIGPTRFSRNMTVVRDGGRLVLVNSVRLDDAGLKSLNALGRVTDVVRLAFGHGSDDRFYKGRYDAKVWAVAGQKYFSGINPAKGRIYFTPDGWLDTGDEPPIPGASMYRIDCDMPEGLLRIDAGGGTLISGDSLQNWATADDHFNTLGKLVFRAMGFIRPHNIGPGWVKACKPAAQQLTGVLDLPFENLLPGHGAPVLGGARDKYRPVIERYAAKRGG